jgi:hypothetical protein
VASKDTRINLRPRLIIKAKHNGMHQGNLGQVVKLLHDHAVPQQISSQSTANTLMERPCGTSGYAISRRRGCQGDLLAYSGFMRQSDGRGKGAQYGRPGCIASLLAIIALGSAVQATAETQTIANGLEVHETALILNPEAPTHLLTKESCANATTGWKIVPQSVRTEVVTARMMDPSGDPDWKVEKAEARTRIDNADSRICLSGYCQGPIQFECEIQVRASWQETR